MVRDLIRVAECLAICVVGLLLANGTWQFLESILAAPVASLFGLFGQMPDVILIGPEPAERWPVLVASVMSASTLAFGNSATSRRALLLLALATGATVVFAVGIMDRPTSTMLLLIFAWLVGSILVLVLGKSLQEFVWTNSWCRRHLAERALVVTPSAPTPTFPLEMAHILGSDVDLMAIVVDEPSQSYNHSHADAVRIFSDASELGNIARTLQADRVILAGTSDTATRRFIEYLRDHPVRIEFVAPSYENQHSALATIADAPLFRWRGVAKRLEDLIISFVVLPWLLLVFAIVAIAIKLDSPGPVFFRQPRDGFGNRPITVYKFRTMRQDACDLKGATQTVRGDARITRLGSFLRKTSIDELPQIFNVIRGDMSWVGPRPHPVGMLTQGSPCAEIDIRYPARHRMNPGITGLAQISGCRGAVEDEAELRHRIDFDLAYIERWSVICDLRIIASTILTVLTHKNAF